MNRFCFPGEGELAKTRVLHVFQLQHIERVVQNFIQFKLDFDIFSLKNL